MLDVVETKTRVHLEQRSMTALTSRTEGTMLSETFLWLTFWVLYQMQKLYSVLYPRTIEKLWQNVENAKRES
jgi:hypothetical protein